MGPSAKAKDVIDATPRNSGPLEPEERSSYQMLKVGVRENCFVRATDFNELEDLPELGTSCVLSGRVSMILAGAPYSNRDVQRQASSPRNVLSKNGIENALSYTSAVKALGAHLHFSRSSSMFSHWNRSLRARMELVEYLEAGAEKKEERTSHVLEAED